MLQAIIALISLAVCTGVWHETCGCKLAWRAALRLIRVKCGGLWVKQIRVKQIRVKQIKVKQIRVKQIRVKVSSH